LDVRVTELLARWRTGDPDAAQALVPRVEDELRRIAARQLRREPVRSLFQTSALVNEAYLRLAENPPDTRDRAHFFSIAARIMRHILVDAARARRRAKRDGLRISLSGAEPAGVDNATEILVLDDLLEKLAAFDPRKARVVEMRFFGGMEVEEVAEALGVSPNTVIRDWSIARAWLHKELE
jgi:RNA polymerase sigma-70 factor (ECF subfamily)